MRVQYLVAALGALGLAGLGLSLWLQHGCARGKLPPGRRRACAALAVALGIAAPIALLPGLICLALWLVRLHG